MKVTMAKLRFIIREAMDEEGKPAGEHPAMSGDDDTDSGSSATGGSETTPKAKGFYDYEYDNMHDAGGNLMFRSPWYAPGTSGDQFRDEDPMAHLGFHVPQSPGSTPPGAEGEEGTASRGEETDIDDPSDLPA